MPLLVLLLVLAWLFYDGGGNPIDGLTDTLNRITRGSKLTRAKVGDDGVVPGTPDELAAEAGLDVDAYSLARMIASEDASASNLVKASICWSAINYAAQTGQSVTHLLTHAKDPDHSGHYGRFVDPATGAADRYCSTALDPYDGDGQIAAGCLAGSIPDPSRGRATHYDNPSGEKNPDAIAKKRAGEGLVAVAIDGIDQDADDIRFWGPA